MLAAICVTIMATSALKCDVGPEARISQLFEHPVPGEVLIIDPTDGKMVRVGAPFIVREDDAQWHQLMAVLKLSAELRSTAP